MNTLLLLALPLLLLGQQDAQKIIDKSIKAHGGKAYNEKSFQFNFRDRSYTYSILKAFIDILVPPKKKRVHMRIY